MTEELLAKIDVERRTTRGRACPVCGGKIIPSIRAVYTAANPEDAFSIFQCERCGYEEMVSKKAPAGKSHAAKAAPPAITTTQVVVTSPKPPMLDSKGRALPPDVTAIIIRLGQTDATDS